MHLELFPENTNSVNEFTMILVDPDITGKSNAPDDLPAAHLAKVSSHKSIKAPVDIYDYDASITEACNQYRFDNGECQTHSNDTGTTRDVTIESNQPLSVDESASFLSPIQHIRNGLPESSCQSADTLKQIMVTGPTSTERNATAAYELYLQQLSSTPGKTRKLKPQAVKVQQPEPIPTGIIDTTGATSLRNGMSSKGKHFGEQACRNCNKRHRRCDRKEPSCSECITRDLVCGYRWSKTSHRDGASVVEASDGKYSRLLTDRFCKRCSETESICDRAHPFCSSCLVDAAECEYPRSEEESRQDDPLTKSIPTSNTIGNCSLNAQNTQQMSFMSSQSQTELNQVLPSSSGGEAGVDGYIDYEDMPTTVESFSEDPNYSESTSRSSSPLRRKRKCSSTLLKYSHDSILYKCRKRLEKPNDHPLADSKVLNSVDGLIPDCNLYHRKLKRPAKPLASIPVAKGQVRIRNRIKSPLQVDFRSRQIMQIRSSTSSPESTMIKLRIRCQDHCNASNLGSRLTERDVSRVSSTDLEIDMNDTNVVPGNNHHLTLFQSSGRTSQAAGIPSKYFQCQESESAKLKGNVMRNSEALNEESYKPPHTKGCERYDWPFRKDILLDKNAPEGLVRPLTNTEQAIDQDTLLTINDNILEQPSIQDLWRKIDLLHKIPFRRLRRIDEYLSSQLPEDDNLCKKLWLLISTAVQDHSRMSLVSDVLGLITNDLMTFMNLNQNPDPRDTERDSVIWELIGESILSDVGPSPWTGLIEPYTKFLADRAVHDRLQVML